MKVEIWSDVMCPFCYIGKRKFEAALASFEYKNQVEISWKNFQLNPEMEDQIDKDVYTYLAEVKNQTRDWSIKMHEHVVASAKTVGLDYRFDLAKVCNSFDAHRLIQFAKTKGLGDEMEERLFKAYFTEGAAISDFKTLTRLGSEIGLNSSEIETMLNSELFTQEVKQDLAEAQQLGISGVPFFVFDRKYAVSGAQESSTFIEVLEKAFADK